MKRHLVTGGAGFVGSEIVAQLLELGESVRVLDTSCDLHLAKDVDLVQGSILDRAVVRQAMRDIDVVHHCAALVPLAKAGEKYREVNFHGTQIVHGEALEAGVEHFCHISSSSVFSMADRDGSPLSEGAAPNPFERYGLSKKMADEFIIGEIEQHSSMKCSILRPRTVIGPKRLGILELLFQWLKLGAPVFYLGSGNNLFQLIDVRDLARASLRAAKCGRGGLFHLGADRYGTLRETLENLCVHANSGSKAVGLPVAPVQVTLAILDRLALSPLSQWHYRSSHLSWHFDITKAKRDLDWNPQYSNDAMMADAYDWYSANGVPSKPSGSRHLSGVRWQALACVKQLRARRIAVRAGTLLSVGICLFFCTDLLRRLFSIAFHLNWDEAMYAQSAQLLMAGKLPYRDFWDINPPLIMYLNLIPVSLARATALPIDLIVKLLVLAMMAFGLCQLAASTYGRKLTRFATVGAGYVFVSWWAQAYTQFAQRDHLFVLAFIPYLFLRLQSVRRRPILEFASVLTCALMACLRPSFVLLVLVSELAVYLRRRRVNVSSAVAFVTPIVLYAFIFLSWPAAVIRTFWLEHVPLVLQLYGSYNDSWQAMFHLCWRYGVFAILLSVGMYRLSRMPSPQAELLRCFSFLIPLALAAVLISQKAWEYHLLTLVGLLSTGAMVALEFNLQSGLISNKHKIYSSLALIATMLVAFFPSLTLLTHELRTGDEKAWYDFQTEKFATARPGNKVVVFSPVPVLSYPMFLERGLLPGSRYLMLYPLAFFNQSRERLEFFNSPGVAALQLDPRERKFVDEIAEDLKKNEPDLLYFPVREGHIAAGFNAIKYARSVGWFDVIRGKYQIVWRNDHGLLLRLRDRVL